MQGREELFEQAKKIAKHVRNMENDPLVGDFIRFSVEY